MSPFRRRFCTRSTWPSTTDDTAGHHPMPEFCTHGAQTTQAERPAVRSACCKSTMASMTDASASPEPASPESHKPRTEPSVGQRRCHAVRGLRAPEPLEAEPPTVARWLAFAGVLLGALLGGMIGYGAADLLEFPGWVVALAGVLFALGGAVWSWVIAQLTLRAMNEWNAVQHPEDPRL